MITYELHRKHLLLK